MDIFAFNPNIVQHIWWHLSISLGLCILVIGAIFVDLWDGVYTAKKTHQKIKSHKLRITGEKVAEYFRFIFIVFLLDTVGVLLPWYALPYLTMVMAVGLIGVEIKSLFEHAKERKSKATEVKDVIGIIIKAANDHDATKAIERVSDYLETKSV